MGYDKRLPTAQGLRLCATVCTHAHCNYIGGSCDVNLSDGDCTSVGATQPTQLPPHVVSFRLICISTDESPFLIHGHYAEWNIRL